MMNIITPASLESIEEIEITNADNVEVAEPTIETPKVALKVNLSLEGVAYAALVLFALALRLIQLGTIPLSDAEAHEALAVFRAIQPHAAGTPLVSLNPLMFSFNALVMAIMGTDNIMARIATVLLG